MNRTGWVGVLVVSGLAAVVVALVFGPSGAGLDRSLERAKAAYARGDWAAAEAEAGRRLAARPDDPDALRLKARALARQGKAAEALALDAALGGDRLEAEDLSLAGRALVKAGRPVLGLAALGAAAKLDPSHRETLDALGAGRPEGATAADVGKADRLGAAPSPAGLAELVVALATADGPDALLDRVLRLGRPAVLKVASTADARKLVARVLLEEGRAGDALAVLARAPDRADPEHDWLLSRAYLVNGAVEKAAEASARAGDYARGHAIDPEPARYVGAAACVRCHAPVYESQQSSRHARTVTMGAGLKDAPLPEGPVTDPGNPSVVHTFARSGADVTVEADVEGRKLKAPVDYALGSGRHGQTMLAREATGAHRSLRLSYYAGGACWGLTSGFDPKPEQAETYVGDLLSEESFNKCLNCHTTRFTSERDRKGPEAADHAIGCERCHGPADHHVRAVEAGLPDLAIARPKLATPAERLNLCGQCHGPDGVIPPADPRFVRFQAATLPYSRCVTESGGRLDCVACHDPHGDLKTEPAYYEARCLACHGGAAPKAFRFEPVAAKPCPVNAKADCVKCHMPKSDEVMPFTRFTQHHIRVHRAEGGG